MCSIPESPSKFDISDQEKDKLVGVVIRYILFKNEQTSGCPIRREELTQLISGNGYKQRNLPTYVISEVKSKLSSIFGYELMELQRSRPSVTSGRSSQAQQAEAKSYVIVSKLPSDVYMKYVEDTNSSHMNGITFAVVGIIQLSGGKMTEENLWHHLRRLGLDENEANMKMTLETLVNQRYLQKEKVNGPEGTIMHFQLAERALETTFYDRIKEYVAQIMQKDQISLDED